MSDSPHPLPSAEPLSLDMTASLHLLAWAEHGLPDAAQVGYGVWLQAVLNGLCALSSRDPLTGLANRLQFNLMLAREIDRVGRVGEPALLLMVDIDYLKQVNDNCGHAVGDLMIQAVAQALSKSVRPMDTVARLGGDEFAVIVPNCKPAFGKNVAERIRKNVAQALVHISTHDTLSVTVSMGGAYAAPSVRAGTEPWIMAADQQLYLAKAQGRNHACLELATEHKQRPVIVQDTTAPGA
jgi:diguanylate cyclase